MTKGIPHSRARGRAERERGDGRRPIQPVRVVEARVAVHVGEIQPAFCVHSDTQRIHEQDGKRDAKQQAKGQQQRLEDASDDDKDKAHHHRQTQRQSRVLLRLPINLRVHIQRHRRAVAPRIPLNVVSQSLRVLLCRTVEGIEVGIQHQQGSRLLGVHSRLEQLRVQCIRRRRAQRQMTRDPCC